MAQNIGEAQINLSVNTSQMEREVSAALKRLESRGFNIGQGINAKAFTQPLGRITGAANEFQKSLDASNARVIAFGASAGAIYNIQRAFTALISSTIEVQKSLTDINVILGASQKTLGQFGDKLFEIAKNSGQAFSTVATAAGELARQGLTVEQTLKRTSDALILARLSGLDAASSVEALTASINSFNKSALDSNQIVNKLAAVDAAFAVSSGDLAEALKRVGSSAEDVGVSFDQLLAIVASVNQTTARGGAVIGNSLKTIFTRVQRTEVLDQLEALGVAVRDLNGNTAPAIQILTGLAQKFDELGDAQRSQVAELVGGVFQINILKAALGDLSKQYSVYGNALNIATNASDEAIRRNEELNKTLAALLNKTLANLTKVGSEIGGLTLQPAIEKVLGGLNTALESFDVKGDSVGSKIGKGIFEGIGSFISGPGLALLIGVFGKIFLNLTKFTTDAVRTVLGLNKEAQAQAQIQERINSILAQNPALVQNILNKQVSLLQVEKDILTVIQAQAQARQQTTAIATTLTKGLISRGVTAEKGVIKTKSQGFIPNYSANKEIIGAISGGYMPGEVRSMNIPNYGRVTYNTAEEVKKFPGLSQPGIMPPENSEAGKNYKQKFKDKYGIDPYASKGFIPNFAARLATNSQIAGMIDQGYVRVTGNELKTYLTGAGGVLDSKRATQFGAITKYNEYWVPESRFNKLVYSSKAELESISKKKGAVFEQKGGVPLDYALVYPGFQETNRFPTKGKTSKGKDVGFYAVPFPGQLKNKKNTLIGPGVYGNAINALVDSSASFLTGLAGVSPSVVNSSKFKRYLKSNITQDQLGTLVGNVFEGGILAALEIAPSDRTRVLDLTAKELQKVGQTFKISSLSAGDFLGGDFKNSLSVNNRNSMAEKIVSSNMTKALGFIPNFSPLEKALKTEEMMGGKGVLDYQQGIGLYVRDGKTQPNFAAVMRDHPEGIQTATKNSKMMQSMASNGFVPNFAVGGFDPMTLYFLAQSFLQGGPENKESLKAAESKLTDILNQRGQKQAEILAEEKKSNPSRKRLAKLDDELESIKQEEIAQRKAINAQTPVFARKGGNFVGGVTGVGGRFLSRYGAGLALGAPIVSGIASEFIGDEVTRGGRAAKAGTLGIGTTLAYAGLGSQIGGPYGAAIGGAIGGISTAIDIIKEFNDIMPELAKSAENAQEKLNNVNSSTQLMITSLETLSNIQNNSSLNAEQAAKLQQKATEDFAASVASLDAIIPGAGKEIEDLYRKIGNTTELRTKITELQAEAQKSSQSIITGTSLIARNKKIEDLIGPTFLDNIFGEIESRSEKYKNLSPLKQKEIQSGYTSGALDLRNLFASVSQTGQAFSSSQIKELSGEFINKSIPEIEQTLQSMVKLDEVAYVTDIIKNINPDVFKEMIQKLYELQLRTEKIQAAAKDFEKNLGTGTAKIKDIEGLKQAFLTGNLDKNLGNINYSDIIGTSANLGLRGQGMQSLTSTYEQEFTALGQELGNTTVGLQKMTEFSSAAAQVQKDYRNGLINLSQATERLKLEFDKIMFKQNEKTMFSDERAQTAMDLRRRNLQQGNFAEGFDPLNSFFDRFGDNAITTADKINKSFANLAENMQTGFEDAFGSFIDGTKTAEDAMRDMVLNLSQQIIKEQFSTNMRGLIGQLTGGGGAGTGIGGVGNSGGILGGIFSSIFGGGKAKGGIIRKYSSGGHVQGGSGVRDDVPAMLTDGEYVLRKSAVNKYGKGMLDMLNRGGMVRGYAMGGSVNSILANAYDYYGPGGDLLQGEYTPEAFKRTIKSPEELKNIPDLKGVFNISNLLSSQAITDENNPMNQLRTERFSSMLGYQQNVSTFKTSYNESMRQVEEARKQAQEEADKINSERMAAYNRQRSQMFIGGLLSVGMGLVGGLGGAGAFGSAGSFMGNLFGANSNTFAQNVAAMNANPLGGIGNQLLGGIQQFAQIGMGAGGGGGGGMTIGGISPQQQKAMSRSIEDSINQASKTYGPGIYNIPGMGGIGAGGIGGIGAGGFGMPSIPYYGGGAGLNVGLGGGFGQIAGQGLTFTQTKGYLNQNLIQPAGVVPPTGMIRQQSLNVGQVSFGKGFQQPLTVGGVSFGGFAKGGRVKGYQIGGSIRPNGLSATVIRNIMQSEGKMGMQSQRAEYFGFRQGTPQYREIKMFAERFGLDSPMTQELVGQFLTESATNAGALNFKDPGIQGSIMSLSHMRGVGGAQAILNSVAGSPIKESGKLTQATIDKINKMDPLIFQSILRQKRIEYDQKIYGNKTDSVMVNGKTKTGKWWDLFGKGLTNRYQKEQELFSAMSVPEFKNFAQSIKRSDQMAGANKSRTGTIAGLGIGAALAGSKIMNIGSEYYGPMTNVIRKLPAGINLGNVSRLGQSIPQSTASLYDSLLASNKAFEGGARLIATPGAPSQGLFPPGQGPSLLSRSLSSLKGFGGRLFRGAALTPALEFLNPPSLGPTSGKEYEIEMGYRDQRTGELTDLGRRVLGENMIGNNFPSYKPYKPGGLPSSQIGFSAQKTYNTLGSLYEQVGLARNPLSLNPQVPNYLNRFAPFYGSGQNYFNSIGRSGFNNYMTYLGVGSGSSLNTLSSFRYPMTPTAVNAYAFASPTFGGGATSSGMGMASAASTYFSAGSRLGIAPSWASRATGGPIFGGSSYKDDVPAMLMGGEYVVRKDVVDRMGQPFFDRLNRGQVQGFAEGGPVGTGLPSINGKDQENNDSKKGFTDSLVKLVKSLDSLNRNIEEQNQGARDQENQGKKTNQEGMTGVTNNININVSVDGQGKTKESTDEQTTGQENAGASQEQMRKSLERSRMLSEMLKAQVLKVIIEEQRPGGVLYQGSKGRDLGR